MSVRIQPLLNVSVTLRRIIYPIPMYPNRVTEKKNVHWATMICITLRENFGLLVVKAKGVTSIYLGLEFPMTVLIVCILLIHYTYITMQHFQYILHSIYDS